MSNSKTPHILKNLLEFLDTNPTIEAVVSGCKKHGLLHKTSLVPVATGSSQTIRRLQLFWFDGEKTHFSVATITGLQWRHTSPLTVEGEVKSFVLNENDFTMLMLVKSPTYGVFIQPASLCRPCEVAKTFLYPPILKAKDEEFGEDWYSIGTTLLNRLKKMTTVTLEVLKSGRYYNPTQLVVNVEDTLGAVKVALSKRKRELDSNIDELLNQLAVDKSNYEKVKQELQAIETLMRLYD